MGFGMNCARATTIALGRVSMRLQIWIIGGAFIVFGIVAWVFTFFSLTYVGLILVGIAALILGAFPSNK